VWGPHFDSYDVFLLQAHGQRKWRIGRQKKFELQEGVPLKILKSFKPEAEFVLNPGDMLYLPPGYAHDGIAVGECMTYSIGFKVPRSAELASELLMGLSEEMAENAGSNLDVIYQDPSQAAAIKDASYSCCSAKFCNSISCQSAQRPSHVELLAGRSIDRAQTQCVVRFSRSGYLAVLFLGHAMCSLDRRTKMLFDAKHIFINGESFRAAGRDAKLLQKLANEKFLNANESIGPEPRTAAQLMQAWWEEGWWQSIGLFIERGVI
jgi:50S ribosomal protein L16 3-hydroxylase